MASAQSLAAVPSMRLSRWAYFATAWAASGCGAGPYGYSRVYSPLNEERDAAKGAEPYEVAMAQRQPGEWHGRTVSVFGVVMGVEPMANDHVLVELSVRNLRPRNLCEENVQSSCRVTVGELETARLKAQLQGVRGDEPPVAKGSLVRVIGRLQSEAAGASGRLVSAYYRHWPRTEYVTDTAREYMRR